MNERPRILAAVGLQPTDVAALAALLPEVAAQVGSWQLGEMAQADLVVVDLDATDGLIAQAYAIVADIPCVALDQMGGLTRPFTADSVARVLAQVPKRAARAPVADPAPTAASPEVPTASRTTAEPITRGSLQFGLAPSAGEAELPFEALYSPDLVERIPHASAALPALKAEPAEAAMVEPAIPAVGTPRPAAAPDAVAAQAPAAATSEPESAPTSRTDVPASGSAADAAAAVVQPPRSEMPKAAYPLLEYLKGTLIGLPSRIAPAGLPPLVIDPRAQVFYAEGDLTALAPYYELLLPRTQWLAVMPAQLEAIRAQLPARPFVLLRFHQALLGAGRRLAAHLDPGGTYALKQPLPLGGDLPRVGRVLAVLGAAGGPRGLAEVASQSGTSVVEVYAVVSALDAVGLLQWSPRRKPGVR